MVHGCFGNYFCSWSFLRNDMSCSPILFRIVSVLKPTLNDKGKHIGINNVLGYLLHLSYQYKFLLLGFEYKIHWTVPFAGKYYKTVQCKYLLFHQTKNCNRIFVKCNISRPLIFVHLVIKVTTLCILWLPRRHPDPSLNNSWDMHSWIWITSYYLTKRPIIHNSK